MALHNRLLPIVTITGSSLVVGCGGNTGGSCGSYGSSAACVPPSIAGPGYYEGTLTSQAASSGNSVVAIIADNGDGIMSGQDGTYYRFNLNFSGSGVSGPYYGISQGPAFPNGTDATTGSISALATAPGLNGSITDQTSAVQTLQLNFDTVYNLGSSLPTLEGTWSYTANGFSLTATIRPDGTFSAVDSNNCSYTGAFNIIDPYYNAYGESYVRACGGVSVSFTGLATYLPAGGSTMNADIKMMADDNASEFLTADLR